ncbi:MAG: response regulator [Deltaproteobacteria bacterium]|nr:response regulator [Deltaproteobacteria bacterium]
MSKILIVEDHADSRYMLERLLTSRGYQVTPAENGEEALRLAQEDPPDVIISDIMMPVMNGFKLCCEVKKDPTLSHLPFIFYTATFVDEDDRKLAMGLGASRFVVKPTDGDQFLEILEDALREHRHGILPVPEGPLEHQETLLEMYENSITRKLAETVEKLQEERRALIQSERRLKEAQELAHIGHWELDLKNDLLEWSDEIYRILGVKPGAFDPSYKTLMGMEVIHPDDRADVAKAHRDSLSKKTACDIEYRLLLKDGTVKYVNERFQTLFDDDGMPICAMGTIQDITERKQDESEREELQAQLLQAQKLEAVGRLAGGVAHDFNNLLTVILGYGEMALQDLHPDHPHHSLLSQIRDAGNRASNLTRQLLAFSRKQVLEMQVVDINGVVRGFEKLMRRVIGEDVQLKMSVHGGPVRVKADVSQLEQVLMNLAVNARDAMPDGGALAIETAIVDLDRAYCSTKPDVVPGVYAMITFADTGVGMEGGILNQIFDPFFTTKDSDRGTGLGLATSYGIVKQHRGDIWVYSEPGQGTTFKVYLPLALDEEETEPTAIERPRPVKGTGTVLVVEDDPSVLRLAGELLRGYGYHVLEAVNPETALEQARTHRTPIDLILADVILPGMKGPEMVEKIREIHPRTKVLHMSGYTEDLIADNGILAKGVMFLPKPFTAEALRQKVAAALGTTKNEA